MKSKKLSNKLQLNKTTVVNFGKDEMAQVKGGLWSIIQCTDKCTLEEVCTGLTICTVWNCTIAAALCPKD